MKFLYTITFILTILTTCYCGIADFGPEELVKMAPNVTIRTVVYKNEPTKLLSRAKNNLMFYVVNDSPMNITFNKFFGELTDPKDFSRVIEKLADFNVNKVIEPSAKGFLDYKFRVRTKNMDVMGVTVSVEFTDENGGFWMTSPLNKTVQVTLDETEAKWEKEIYTTITYFVIEISNNPIFHNPETATQQDINNGIDWYINTLATEFQDEEPWLEEEFINSCYSLFSSKMFLYYGTQVIERLLERTISSLAKLWVEFTLLALSGEKNKHLFVISKKHQLFSRLTQLILESEDQTTKFTAINLACGLVQNGGIGLAEHRIVDETFIEYILCYVEETSAFMNEEFTTTATKLLLSIDDYYYKNFRKLTLFKDSHMGRTALGNIGFGNSLKNKSTDLGNLGYLDGLNVPESPLQKILINKRMGMCKGFAENIVFLFNRLEENLEAIEMTLMFLKRVFDSNILCTMFYINDLCVMVDIIVRELEAATEPDKKICQLYLLVIDSILKLDEYISCKHKIYDLELLLVSMLRKLLEDNSMSSDTIDENGKPKFYAEYNANTSHKGPELSSREELRSMSMRTESTQIYQMIATRKKVGKVAGSEQTLESDFGYNKQLHDLEFLVKKSLANPYPQTRNLNPQSNPPSSTHQNRAVFPKSFKAINNLELGGDTGYSKSNLKSNFSSNTSQLPKQKVLSSSIISSSQSPSVIPQQQQKPTNFNKEKPINVKQRPKSKSASKILPKSPFGNINMQEGGYQSVEQINSYFTKHRQETDLTKTQANLYSNQVLSPCSPQKITLPISQVLPISQKNKHKNVSPSVKDESHTKKSLINHGKSGSHNKTKSLGNYKINSNADFTNDLSGISSFEKLPSLESLNTYLESIKFDQKDLTSINKTIFSKSELKNPSKLHTSLLAFSNKNSLNSPIEHKPDMPHDSPSFSYSASPTNKSSLKYPKKSHNNLKLFAETQTTETSLNIQTNDIKNKENGTHTIEKTIYIGSVSHVPREKSSDLTIIQDESILPTGIETNSFSNENLQEKENKIEELDKNSQQENPNKQVLLDIKDTRKLDVLKNEDTLQLKSKTIKDLENDNEIQEKLSIEKENTTETRQEEITKDIGTKEITKDIEKKKYVDKIKKTPNISQNIDNKEKKVISENTETKSANDGISTTVSVDEMSKEKEIDLDRTKKPIESKKDTKGMILDVAPRKLYNSEKPGEKTPEVKRLSKLVMDLKVDTLSLEERKEPVNNETLVKTEQEKNSRKSNSEPQSAGFFSKQWMNNDDNLPLPPPPTLPISRSARDGSRSSTPTQNILNKLTSMFAIDSGSKSDRPISRSNGDSAQVSNDSENEAESLLKHKRQINNLKKKLKKQVDYTDEQDLIIDEQEKEIKRLLEENAKLCMEKVQVENEIEDLSKSLFTEANELVKNEAILRNKAEKLVEELRSEVEQLKAQLAKYFNQRPIELSKDEAHENTHLSSFPSSMVMAFIPRFHSPDFWLARVFDLFGVNKQEWKYIPGQTKFTTWSEVLMGTTIYLLIVFGGKAVMKNQKPFELKTVWRFHNLTLTVMSLLLLILFAEQLIPNLLNHSLFWNICHRNAWNAKLELLYYINYLIKWYEFIDTFLLVLKKKNTPFLHVYHHSMTMILCFTQLQGMTSVSWVPVTINLFVHVIMYYYYYLTALGIRVWWKKLVTTMQIVQFIIDLGFVYFCTYIYYAHKYRLAFSFKESCNGTEFAAIFGCLLLSSYLLLFVQFFIDTYNQKRKDRKAKAKARSAKKHTSQPKN
ncbi:hypothetical protein BB559_003628 [Furculomyces boomerangus]|uniref:Elongation of fatty acids protein n=1 Tax=Furculomyces boomerangus TaxID=61424 RepID=A0A2T9YKA6_9FUNG|nr:hypothetical protein BB559_003628 [Furculomyces boomerangus]